jgi:hypothetical protein
MHTAEASTRTDPDEDDPRYEKTPKTKRKQVSVRPVTSIRSSSSSSRSQRANRRSISYEEPSSDEDNDEEDQSMFNAIMKIKSLKRDILAS